MNDTELRSRLQELTDPALAPRPSRSELEDRIARRSRRRRVVTAAAAALVLVVAGAFAVSGWPWNRAPGYVQVDDPTSAQSEASQPSDEDPSAMTDAELAAELDHMTSGSFSGSGETIPDGVFYIFSLGSELLGGRGDPRGTDSWWTQQSFQAPSDLADFTDDYIADNRTSDYLDSHPRTVALLREVADRLRRMPPPQRDPYEIDVGEGRVPVPEMAGHGMQGIDDIVDAGSMLVAVGDAGGESPGSRPVRRPVVLVSTDHGDSWESIELAEQGMADWEVDDINVAGDRMVVSGSVATDGTEARPVAAVSSDGRDWHPVRFPEGVIGTINDVTSTQDGRIVAVGWGPDGPAVWTSTNARDFDAVEIPGDVGSAIEWVTDGSAGLVAVAGARDERTSVLRSRDGTRWESQPASEVGLPDGTLELGNVEWLADRYVIVGTGTGSEGAWWSTDGREWQQLELEAVDDMVASMLFDVTTDPQGRLVVVGAVRDRSDRRWPRAAWWHQTADGFPLRLAGRTSTEGIITAATTLGDSVLGVGVTYQAQEGTGDGTVWHPLPTGTGGAISKDP